MTHIDPYREGRHLKKEVTSVKHKPAGGIAMPDGLNSLINFAICQSQMFAIEVYCQNLALSIRQHKDLHTALVASYR